MQIQADVVTRTEGKDGNWSVTFRPVWDLTPPWFRIVTIEELTKEGAAGFTPGAMVAISIEVVDDTAPEAT